VRRRLLEPGGLGLGAVAVLGVALALVGVVLAAEGRQWEETFIRANQAYADERFEEAVRGYTELIRSGHGSGHVYYDLGNAYTRLNQLGRAILNYERALLALPRDGDLDFNLRYARGQLKDVMPESREMHPAAFFFLDRLTLREFFRVFAVVNGLFWAGLLARLHARSAWIHSLFLLLLVCWLAAGLSFGLKWRLLRTDDRAVILAGEVEVRAGPDERRTVLFELHEGATVRQVKSEGEWSLVALADGKRGWLKAERLERIVPPRE
jgi:tetratricopeptide (TPR) repeat protein